MLPGELQIALQAYLQAVLPDRAELAVENFRLLNSGWESEVYGFDLLSGAAGEREALVLRAYAGQQGAEKAQVESGGMRKLHQAGYPVPRVFLVETSPTPLGQPFLLMEQVQGERLWQRLFPVDNPEKKEYFVRFVGLLVQLHRLDWHPFASDPAPIERGGASYLLRGMLAFWKTLVLPDQSPGFYQGLSWAEERLAELPVVPPAPVHLDFHPENILVRADGSMSVLDWTQFCLSDPRLDLAWTMMLMGSTTGWDIRDAILTEYERQSGTPAAGIEVFEVLACIKRLYSVAVSLTAGAETMGMRAGAEAQMRRQIDDVARVYQHFQQLSGLRLPEIEQLLAAYS